jgi:predicted amidohydrolase YtcJ
MLCTACRQAAPPPADLILLNGNVYTLSWPDPSGNSGHPAASAPHGSGIWKGDAQALGIRNGLVVFVGRNEDAERYRASATQVVDLHGSTVVPGLVDAHVHILELGRKLDRVDLVGVQTEAEAVEKAAAWATKMPPGSWVVGYGWDDGAWANRYPDMKLLSAKVPDHPVYLRGLHGYAVWGNHLAFEKAGITATTQPPAGGEIRKDRSGRPTGILLNQAVTLLERAVPAETPEQVKQKVATALQAMARAGYVAVHEAGADTALMNAFESLAAEHRLPVRMYAMLSGRDHDLLRRWIARGPDRSTDKLLTTRSVKVFFDGALGSRGARLLADYSDAPGQRGVGGPENGFDPKLVADTMKAGFQLSVHAIGDGANREALDYIESVQRGQFPASASSDPRRFRALARDDARHRIEHAQVLDTRDIPRFASLNVIASMQPPHATEDMGWAEQRLGADRVQRAYAWRTLRQAGARLVFSSDLPGTDYDIFYGLHSAITRRDKSAQPAGGWHAEQRMSPEEALRGYTSWAAYTAFLEKETGVLAPGRWADVTVMNIDPLALGERDPDRLLGGRIEMTIVAGRVVYQLR